MKKRGTALLLALTLGICMAGCGAQSEETDDSSQTAQTQDDTDTVNSQEEEQGSAGGQGNVLVAYFSWADNAVLEDDVDAVSSPSVIPPGNVQQLAGWVQEETGGDLFSIKVTDPYPSDWDECLDRANEEVSEDTRPELTENVENWISTIRSFWDILTGGTASPWRCCLSWRIMICPAKTYISSVPTAREDLLTAWTS